MKRAVWMAVSAGLVVILISCGGTNYNGGLIIPSGNKNSKHPISTLNLRAFVTDQFNSRIHVLDAKYDANYGATIATDLEPTLLQLTPDKKLVIAFAIGSNTLQAFDPALEATTGSVILPNWTESFVIGPDNSSIYAAVRNATVTAGTVPGALEVVTLSQGAITKTVAIPKAHWIVLSHNGSKLLVFSDDSDSVTVVNTSDFTTTTVGGFDRPVWGVFSSDDSTAYILNCGSECGGTQPGVSALSVANNTIGATVAVEGATMGLLDGTNLYVAGTGAGGGKLNVVNTSNMTVSKSGVAVSDGYHWRMALVSGQLFVGARQCSNIGGGCLAIYNTSTGTASFQSAPGDVTGIEGIPNRSVVYVVQGGELVIYDTTSDKPQTRQIDIVGKAYDVRYVE